MTTDTARRTGATPEQIQAAVNRTAVANGLGPWIVEPQVRFVARHLVPPSDRIVPADLLARAAAAIERGDRLPSLRAELLAAIGGGEDR